MKRFLTIIALLLIAQIAMSQNYLASKEDLKKHSDKVMGMLRNSEIDNAFAELQKYWPLPENEIISLATQTTKQFNMVSDRFGKVVGTDFIKDKTVKDFIVRKIYVIRHEKHIVRVLFTYYKNEKGWILNGFKWDDQFDDLFDQ